MSTMHKLLDAIAQGPSPIIKRTLVEPGFIVSTINSVDQGPETAILDDRGVYPVERYGSVEEAEGGHRQWVALLHDGLRKVQKLGYDDIVTPRQIHLTPMSPKEFEEQKERYDNQPTST